jgi:hypothetical protein
MTERWLWTQKENFGPSPRYGHAMAYDAARQRVVLFGGGVPEGAVIRALNDTWEWDGSAWAQVADTGPSARLLAGMVYDDARQRLVLFGGSEAGGPLNGDTWEWDGEDWTQVADIGPTPRSLLAVAYDKVRRHVVLFGGTPTGGALYLNDTWAWDGTEWTQIADTGPSARISHAMVFDSSRECLALFGGTQATMVGNDTWEWGDEAEWIMRHAMGPRDFRTPKMVYTGKHTALYGCSVLTGKAQTWEWDGRVWTQRQDMGPSARTQPAVAYDSQRDRMVLFGGQPFPVAAGTASLGDTWELAIVEPRPE